MKTKKIPDEMLINTKKSAKENTKKSYNKDLNSSELNPNAQTNNLCTDGYGNFGSYEWSESTFERMRKESHELAFLFLFQYETGCRLSEAQLITHDMILRDGSVKLKATKNSEDRVVTAGRCAKWLIDCRKARCSPFMNYNRFFIHRFYKKYGVVFKSENSQKNSTTHALRHAKVQTLRNESVDNQQISKTIGHKNTKNTEFYGKGK